MPRVDEESRFAKAVIAVRAWLPTVRHYLTDRYAAVRETPAVIWSLPELRYTLIVIAAAAALWTVKWTLAALSPVPASQIQPFATSGDFQVMCSNEACQHRFVVHRKLKFNDFPVQCPRCQGKSGCRALRCHSKTCHGALVPAELIRGNYVCSRCNVVIKKQ